MTRPSLRTVRLSIHPSKISTSWSLIHRTDDGRTVFDRHLHMGFMDHEEAPVGVADVSRVLRHIADELDRRMGVEPAAEPHREPLGAVGGGLEHRPGRVCADQCPLCGEHLDGMPSDD